MGQLILLQTLAVLALLSTIICGLPTPAEPGDIGGQKWLLDRFSLILTKKGARWGKISKTWIRKKLGIDDPTFDPEEAMRRAKLFADCIRDEVSLVKRRSGKD